VLFGVGVHLRTVTRDGWVCTEYAPGTVHDGTEGELYSLADDPLQRVNRWDDPSVRAVRDDLVADLSAQLSAVKQQLAVEAEKARVVEAQLQANREMARSYVKKGRGQDLAR
jgi:hypothetical protein